jgi:hypothetical protein
LDIAAGQYVAILEAKDMFCADHLDKMVKSLADSCARVAYSGAQWVEQDRTVARMESVSDVPARLRSANVLPLGAYVFEHALVADGCRLPEGPLEQSSWAFWLELAERAPFQSVPSIGVIVARQTSTDSRSASNTAGAYLTSRFQGFTTEQWLQTLAATERAAAQSAEQAQSARAKCESTESALAELQLRNASLESDMADKQEERDQMAIELLDLRSQLVHWRAMAEVESQRANALAGSLDAYASSTSWRITAPIRWASRILRRTTR